MRYEKYAIILLFPMILSFMTAADLAASPPATIRHLQSKPKFFTRTRIITLSAGAAMMAADIITTDQALKIPAAHEANPLGQSESARYALKFIGLGAGMGISYALRRSGHYKAA